MRTWIIALSAVLALSLGAPGWSQGSGAVGLEQLARAVETRDVATLDRAYADKALFKDLADLDPEGAVGVLFDMAEAYAAAGRSGRAIEAADRAVDLAKLRFGAKSPELIDALRRRAALLLEERPSLAAADLERAKAIAEAVAGPASQAYADLDGRLRQAERRADALGQKNNTAPPPVTPPPEGEPPDSARPDEVGPSGKAEAFDLVEVFYATQRKRTGQKAATQFYSGKRGALEFGRAVVSVPRARDVGSLPLPSIWTLDVRPDPARHFILKDVDPYSGRNDFFVAVSERVAGTRKKEVFVFVHGFNTSFEGATLRTAQLAADLRIDGAPILWSWPSAGRLLAYFEDEKQAESRREAEALEAFLRDVVARTGAERVHLIAHSMGNRPLMAALARIGNPPEGARPMFREIVFAAPDVGVREFDDVWPKFNRLGARFTLYASSRDKALALSQRINGMQRIGDAKPIVLKAGLQSIDTTAASGGLLGHDDFAGTALDDFRAVIWLSLAPGRRCVLSSGDDAASWWRFGGACPPTEFRDAALAIRAAGGVSEAIAKIDSDMSSASLEARPALERLRRQLVSLNVEH